MSEYDTSYDATSTALSKIASNAIEKLSDVIKVCTKQLRLIEVECRDLREKCADTESRRQEAESKTLILLDDLCRCHERGETEAERWKICAKHANYRHWHDLAEYCLNRAEASRSKEARDAT